MIKAADPTRVKMLLFLLLTLLPFTASAKTVKPITVSQGQSYTDHIALAQDAKDKDIMVKFQFDEQNNTLTVSVISYRTLFVFWDDMRYKSAISRRWLHTDRLPYIATAEEGQRFRLSKALRKQLPKPRKEYIFKKWMTYEGLQPQEKDIKMVNSYLEQTFDIQNKRCHVVVHLHDIMMLDLEKQSAARSVYSINTGADLDTEYQITINRNPCFGLDQEVQTARKALDAVRKSYKSLRKTYGKGSVATAESKKTFDDVKATLMSQYQHNNDSSACPDIQACIDQYNLTADSLANMTVSLVTPTDAAAEAAGKILGGKDSEKNAKVVLANAREIDRRVARWLTSRDPAERADILRECQNIIHDTRLIISTLPASESKNVKIFNQAEQYFRRTCR